VHIVVLAQDFGEVLGDVSARIFPSLSAVITQLIATLFIVIMVRKYLWKHAKAYIEKRKEFVHNTVKNAETLKAEAENEMSKAETTLKSAYKEARTIVEDAKVSALNQRDEILTKAEQEAKAKREQANRDIETEKTKAQRQIREEIVDVALVAATKVIGREISDKDTRKLVEDFVKEVGH